MKRQVLTHPHILHTQGMHGGGEESQVVAVLHDVMENSLAKAKRCQYPPFLTFDDIARQFGAPIAAGDLHDNLNKDRIPSYQHDDYASLWRRYEEAVDMLISE